MIHKFFLVMVLASFFTACNRIESRGEELEEEIEEACMPQGINYGPTPGK